MDTPGDMEMLYNVTRLIKDARPASRGCDIRPVENGGGEKRWKGTSSNARDTDFISDETRIVFNDISVSLKRMNDWEHLCARYERRYRSVASCFFKIIDHSVNVSL